MQMPGRDQCRVGRQLRVLVDQPQTQFAERLRELEVAVSNYCRQLEQE
jgi:hypothetical protein